MSTRSTKRASKAAAPVVKVSVSLPPDHDAWLRANAARTGRAYSAVLSEAVADARTRQAQRELLVWLEKGRKKPVTRADIDAVVAEWRAPLARARRSA